MSTTGPGPVGGAPGDAPARAGRQGQGLPRGRRLTHAADFRAAYEQGRRFVGRWMVLWLRRGDGAALRLGVVSSRKVGDAVRRNRARRRLREAFRRHRHRLAGDVDVILVARSGAVRAAWGELVEELLALAARAGILRAAPEDGVD